MEALTRLRALLDRAGADYELIAHSRPIRRTSDAAGMFDLHTAAPTLIVLADGAPVAVILSAGRGRLDLAAARVAARAESLVLADPATVRAATGFEVGAVPLVGHGLPVVFDRRLLELAQVYGGSGDPLHTLRIAPADLERISAPVGWLS